MKSFTCANCKKKCDWRKRNQAVASYALSNTICPDFELQRVNFKKIFSNCFAAGKALFLGFLLALVCAGGFSFWYSWTKSSLEDVAGKEVKPTTVLYVMFHTHK